VADGTRRIADIAEELGYSDAFAFSKAFKQHTGLNPRDWRRQFRQG
jgi:two-component system, response regulator YesN